MTLPLPIRTAGDTAAEHVDDHNEIHGILGGGLPTGLTTAGTGHLANHNTIHTILNSTEGQSLPTGIAAGATGHLSHHNTIHTVLNETPAAAEYGPSDGAAAVRSGAGARTVTNPGGGVSFNSSGSLQTAINANAVGSTFICSVNNPTWNSQVDTGTKAATVIFPGTVGQCVIQGSNAQFIPIRVGPGSTIKGGTWTNFGTADTVHGMNLYGDDARVEDAVVTGMWNSGFAAPGDNVTISHCTTHSNGEGGIGGTGGSSGLTIEYVESYGNNVNLNNPGAAGTYGAGWKVTQSTGGHCHHCYVHDNTGYGAWWDTLNSGWTIEQNVCESNDRAGLFYEANQASVIRRNYIANNGSTASIGGDTSNVMNNVNVRIADSNCTSSNRGEFSRNIVDHTTPAQSSTMGALFMLWDHTGTAARSCQNWDVFENQFWLRGSVNQRVGGQDTATGTFPVWSSNSYYGNQYKVASLSNSYWKWDSGTGGGVSKTWAQWQAFHPGDVDRQLI